MEFPADEKSIELTTLQHRDFRSSNHSVFWKPFIRKSTRLSRAINAAPDERVRCLAYGERGVFRCSRQKPSWTDFREFANFTASEDVRLSEDLEVLNVICRCLACGGAWRCGGGGGEDKGRKGREALPARKAIWTNKGYCAADADAVRKTKRK